jgi:hypothetical protein
MNVKELIKSEYNNDPLWFICDACNCDMYHILEYPTHYHCSCANCGVIKIIKKHYEF